MSKGYKKHKSQAHAIMLATIRCWDVTVVDCIRKRTPQVTLPISRAFRGLRIRLCSRKHWASLRWFRVFMNTWSSKKSSDWLSFPPAQKCCWWMEHLPLCLVSPTATDQAYTNFSICVMKMGKFMHRDSVFQSVCIIGGHVTNHDLCRKYIWYTKI